MKYIAIVVLFVATSVYAGQDELDRDLAKAKIEHDYLVKVCYKKPKEQQPACLREVNLNYSLAVNGLREHHLGQRWDSVLGRTK